MIDHTTKLVRSLVVFKWQRQSNSTSTHSDQNSNFKLNKKKKKNDVQTSAQLHNCHANFYVTRQPPKTGNSCITCTTYIYTHWCTMKTIYHGPHSIVRVGTSKPRKWIIHSGKKTNDLEEEIYVSLVVYIGKVIMMPKLELACSP